MAMKNLVPLMKAVAEEREAEYKRNGGLVKDMSLRDLFAVQALNSPHLTRDWPEEFIRGRGTVNWLDALAGEAYRLADAMLRARKSQRP